jgi:lysophospholipase L1-like esterase
MIKALCIGDSHTAGFPEHDPMFGGNVQSSYQFWLTAKLKDMDFEKKFSFINRGICGDTSGGIVSRLIRGLDTMEVDLIILQGGTNDLGMFSLDETFSNLKRGYSACLKRDLPVIAVTVPPLNFKEYESRVMLINRAIIEYAENNSHTFIADWFKTLRTDDNRLKAEYDEGDGVHLSVQGYKQSGSTLAQPVIDAVASF